MTGLSDYRAQIVRESVEDEDGDVFAAITQSRRRYQYFVQRELTTGENQDIEALSERYSKELKAEKIKKDADRYRELKG